MQVKKTEQVVITLDGDDLKAFRDIFTRLKTDIDLLGFFKNEYPAQSKLIKQLHKELGGNNDE